MNFCVSVCVLHLTCTPRMPKNKKKAPQMRTMFPMGLTEAIRASIASFSLGARLITLEHTNIKKMSESVTDANGAD